MTLKQVGKVLASLLRYKANVHLKQFCPDIAHKLNFGAFSLKQTVALFKKLSWGSSLGSGNYVCLEMLFMLNSCFHSIDS